MLGEGIAIGMAGVLDTMITMMGRATLEITNRPPNAKGFVVVPVRWIVERFLAWFGRFRRLSKDYEHCTKSSEGGIYIAAIAAMLKRLKPTT